MKYTIAFCTILLATTLISMESDIKVTKKKHQLRKTLSSETLKVRHRNQPMLPRSASTPDIINCTESNNVQDDPQLITAAMALLSIKNRE